MEKVEEIEDIKIGECWDGDSYSYGNLGLDRAQMAAQVLIGKHIIRRCPMSTRSCCVGLWIQSKAVGDLEEVKAAENLEEEEDDDGTRETNQRVVHPYNGILSQK